MKINIDRLCKLAGVSPNGHSSERLISEASNRSWHEDNSISSEAEFRYGRNQLNEEAEEALEGLYEVEVDEAMLVQELRRARNILSENRRRIRRKRTLSENRRRVNEERQLKRIIEEEVEDILSDLNLNAQWIYGKRKPRNSRRGSVSTAFPGIGFR